VAFEVVAIPDRVDPSICTDIDGEEAMSQANGPGCAMELFAMKLLLQTRLSEDCKHGKDGTAAVCSGGTW
jgi:hypothetical protein